MVEQAKKVVVVVGRHQRLNAVLEAAFSLVLVIFVGEIDSDERLCTGTIPLKL